MSGAVLVPSASDRFARDPHLLLLHLGQRTPHERDEVEPGSTVQSVGHHLQRGRGPIVTLLVGCATSVVGLGGVVVGLGGVVVGSSIYFFNFLNLILVF